jgi:hypothetical protein
MPGAGRKAARAPAAEFAKRPNLAARVAAPDQLLIVPIISWKG